MENYETEILTLKDKEKFEKFLDAEIGTEYETNEVEIYNAKNQYLGIAFYIMIFDLTINEVKKIRSFENKL